MKGTVQIDLANLEVFKALIALIGKYSEDLPPEMLKEIEEIEKSMDDKK